MLTLLFLNISLIVLDRLTKWLVSDKSIVFKNPKLYFWNVNSVLLYIISGAILLLLIFLFFKTLNLKKKNKKTERRNFLLSAGLLFIIFGGASNLFDRIFFGYVIDWIRVFFLPISIFNIADIMIVLGLFFIVIYIFKSNSYKIKSHKI